MEEIENMKEVVLEIFMESQKSTAFHQKNAIILKEYYEINPKQFLDCLKCVINNILVIEKSTQYLEKTMDFFGKFCSLLKPKNLGNDDEGLDHPLLVDIFSYLLQASGLISDTIRLRSCQLINKIFDSLIGVDLSQDLCEKIENNLLIRLQDPKSSIRQQAVISLHWLQDPTNQEDAIIPELLNLMNSDLYAKVRQLCVEKIAPRKDVIESFIKRLWDVDVNVRFVAYKRLCTLSGFLKISEKRHILQSGFLEKSEKIKEFFYKNFINSWLSHYDNDILKLLKCLRLDADEKDIECTSEIFENVLLIIFDNKPLKELSAFVGVNEKKLIPIENLNWEVVSYWRIYVQYLSKKDEFEEELSNILPELVYFCKYVKQYYASMPKEETTAEFLEQQYTLKQFFLIIKTYDFSDPTSRQCLNALVSNILENIVLTSDVTELVISTLENSIPNAEKRTQFVCEIISEIMNPLNTEENETKQREKDFQISQVVVNIQRMSSEQEDAIKERNFIEAERLNNEINSLQLVLTKLREEILPQQVVRKRANIMTTVKCLDIAAGILLSPQVTSLTPSLKALNENFIYELLISEIDSIRVKAFRCYALCCIIDKESSTNGIHIFSTPILAYQNGEECDTQTLLICISAVVDLLRIYGSQLVAAKEKDELSESREEEHKGIFTGGTAMTDVLQGLVDLMDDEQYSIQERAALGLCKLVLSQRIVSSSLIARLILKWCNPATGDEMNRIKQIIAYTLEKIPLIPQYTEALPEAMLMTIKALYSAPRISPLADVNIENIAKFMMALCKTSADADHIFSNLSITICAEMRDKPNSKLNTLYSKILLLLDIPDTKTLVKDLLRVCDQIRDNISDRIIVNNLLKFITILNDKTKDDPIVTEDENELDELEEAREL